MSGDTHQAGMIDKFLNFIEVAGNKLPDPAVLFLLLQVAIPLRYYLGLAPDELHRTPIPDRFGESGS